MSLSMITEKSMRVFDVIHNNKNKNRTNNEI